MTATQGNHTVHLVRGNLDPEMTAVRLPEVAVKKAKIRPPRRRAVKKEGGTGDGDR